MKSQAITDLDKPWLLDVDHNISASVTIQGSVLEFKSFFRKSKAPNAKRGTIKDLSPGARLRMLKHFQKIDFANYPAPLFLTMTYPDEKDPPSLTERNLHRQHFHRRLESIAGREIPLAWRVEWQDRKSGERQGTVYPHWHWLLFKQDFLPWKRVRNAWKDTIRCDVDPITDIRVVDKASAIQLYMAKYISKEAVSPSLVIAAYHTKLGRQYGWLRKNGIPLQNRHIYCRLTQAQRDKMMAIANDQLPWISEGIEQSFTLFGERAGDAVKILDGKRLDGQ